MFKTLMIGVDETLFFSRKGNVYKFSTQPQLQPIPNHAWGSSFYAASAVLKHRLPFYPLA